MTPKETTLQFGAGGALVGTLTVPRASHPQNPAAAILFNAGVVPRIGPNRLNVRIARELAARGVPTLRFDLSGRGDSAAVRGMASFEEQAVADLRSAMDSVSQCTGVQRFVLLGICSGAENAYHAALADERVIAVSLMDSYHYPTWRTHLNRYLQRAQQQGGVHKAMLNWFRNRIIGTHAVPSANASAAASFGSIRPSADEFATNLRRLLDRGVAIDLLFTGSYVETYNYANQFRDVFARYGVVDRIRVEFDPAIDHTLSFASMQRKMVKRTCDWFIEATRARAVAPEQNAAA